MVQRREVVMEWMDGGVWRCWWTEGAVERWRAATPAWPRRRPEVEKVGGEGDGDARLDLGMDASRDFDPHLICHFYDLALLFYSFLPKKIPFFF